MNKQDKIEEAQIQVDNREHYRPLTTPVAEDTHRRVQQLINELYDGNYIDEITKKNGIVRHQIRLAFQYSTP